MSESYYESDITRMKNLIKVLNHARDLYYNQQRPEISDAEYDKLFDYLKALEEKTNIVFSNSPTQEVGYEVKSELSKVIHSHKMLSLDKTKSVDDIIKFLDNKIGIAMLKLDGLTLSLRYLDGKLVSAETRGDGEVGEDVTHNAKVFSNIPLQIDYKDELVVDGEAIIPYYTFKKINNKLSEDNKYKNPRNLASGSVRQLDSKIAEERNIKFIAWKVVKGLECNSFFTSLNKLSDLGFETVSCVWLSNRIDKKVIEDIVKCLKEDAEATSYPIDGLVFGYDDIEYGESLGMTSHHLRSQLALKFNDEEVETTLLDIEWQVGKSGLITPVAVFEPVEIEGSIVGKASLSNLSVMKETLGDIRYKGQKIYVTKRNAVIPKVEYADKIIPDKQVEELYIPNYCPVCGWKTVISENDKSSVLECINRNCKGKLLGKLVHFCSKDAMDIKGLSEATLELFIKLGYVESFADIYELETRHNYDLYNLEGFGKKSIDNLYKSIRESKNTTLDRFINALSIPLIGKTASKTIAKYFDYDIDSFMNAITGNFNWMKLDDFGVAMEFSIFDYVDDNLGEIKELVKYFTFNKPDNVSGNDNIKEKVFVITGNVEHFKNRDELKNKIESLGGKVTGSVSAKTDYLINNDINSTSSKNKKAKELNIEVLTEEEFLKML